MKTIRKTNSMATLAQRTQASDVQEGARAREEAERARAAAQEEAAHKRREMNQRWGELANKMGAVVEDIVAPFGGRTRVRGVPAQWRVCPLLSAASRVADRCIVAAFSSLSIPEEMVPYLTLYGIYGIYALAMGDEAMQVLNLEAVRSRQRSPTPTSTSARRRRAGLSADQIRSSIVTSSAMAMRFIALTDPGFLPFSISDR